MLTFATASDRRFWMENVIGYPATPVGATDWIESGPRITGAGVGPKGLSTTMPSAAARITMIATSPTMSALVRPPFFFSTSGRGSGEVGPDEASLDSFSEAESELDSEDSIRSPLLTTSGHARADIIVFWLATRILGHPFVGLMLHVRGPDRETPEFRYARMLPSVHRDATPKAAFAPRGPSRGPSQCQIPTFGEPPTRAHDDFRPGVRTSSGQPSHSPSLARGPAPGKWCRELNRWNPHGGSSHSRTERGFFSRSDSISRHGFGRPKRTEAGGAVPRAIATGTSRHGHELV